MHRPTSVLWRTIGRRTQAPLQALALWGAVHLQAGALLSPVDSKETYLTKVPVSGIGVRAGIISGGQQRTFAPGSFAVAMPSGSSGRLCVTISSRDGRYQGTYEYDIQADLVGTLRLRTPTKFSRELREYSTDQMAILASVATNCRVAPSRYVLSSWGSQVATDTVVALLNSRLPTRIVVGRDDRVRDSVPCLPLEGVTTAFNLRCAIPRSMLDSGGRAVVRIQSGQSFSSIALPVILTVP